MYPSDIYMAQADVARAAKVTPNALPYFMSKFKTPTVFVGGKRMMYTNDAEKLIGQIISYYTEKAKTILGKYEVELFKVQDNAPTTNIP